MGVQKKNSRHRSSSSRHVRYFTIFNIETRKFPNRRRYELSAKRIYQQLFPFLPLLIAARRSATICIDFCFRSGHTFVFYSHKKSPPRRYTTPKSRSLLPAAAEAIKCVRELMPPAIGALKLYLKMVDAVVVLWCIQCAHIRIAIAIACTAHIFPNVRLAISGDVCCARTTVFPMSERENCGK